MKVKHCDGFVSYKHAVLCFTQHLLMDLTRVDYLRDYCNVFISCLNSHSDGTHLLQWIRW